jgi:ribose/xylose/arabinose/galactoside ABC-type transport system permease subunit
VVGMTYVIAAAQIDLSVGAMLAWRVSSPP